MDRATKRCGCANSEGIPPFLGDLDHGFEICWYCQAEVISSGSRWSTFFCDACHPHVCGLNDALDALGLVSLPHGRHSLMYGNWEHARPFVATPIVAAWRTSRLRAAWKAYGGDEEPAPWAPFGRFQRRSRARRRRKTLMETTTLVQNSPDDSLLAGLRAANELVAARRAANGADPKPS